MRTPPIALPSALLLAALASAAPAFGAGASVGDKCRPVPPTAAPYLRGGMNGWIAAEEYRFTWVCDAWFLNVDLQGIQDFKIADPAWTPTLTVAGKADAPPVVGPATLPVARGDRGGGRNLTYRFDGLHTVRLSEGADGPVLSIGPRSWDGVPVVPVTNQAALGVRHDSRDPAHKVPFGAVPAGTEVAFALDAPPGVERATLVVETRTLTGNQETIAYREAARVPMSRSVGPGGERWTARHRFDAVGVHGYWFEVVSGGVTHVYQNNAAPIYWTRERGANGLGEVALPPADPAAIRRFRLSVHVPGFAVPEWAPDTVWYYVFPERFRNGDPSNDPSPRTATYQGRPVEAHASWLDRPWRPGSGDGSDDLSNNDFFGGDLAGIIDKLDVIADLGANALYMTPIFAASSNHKYDTADYMAVDPGFGTNADFERLTREAARRGIRVVVDASFNHTGRDSLYFDRYGRFPTLGALEGGRVRADSPYADWYRLDPKAATPDDAYAGWSGAKDLPELDKASPAFRRFAFDDADSVTRTWLARGAAGWRMDVAPWVPDDFWRAWRKAVKSADPQALTIAETWFEASKHLLGDMFDGTMNYVFRNAAVDFAAGGNAAANYRNIELMRELYPEPALFAAMNLLSTHDSARVLHVLGDHGDGGPGAVEARRRYRLALLFQMTYPGAPAIFYGDEVGLGGGDDPDNRRPYPWADLGGRPDMEMRKEFKALIALRKATPVLRRGRLEAPLYLDASTIVMQRRLGRTAALVTLNNRDAVVPLDVPLPPDLARRTFRDALTGEVFAAKQGRLSMTLPALHGRVLLSD